MRFLSLIILGLLSCAKPEHSIRPLVNEYYQVYAQRSDFDYFLSFYADSMELKDYVAGEHITGKTAFEEFIDWNNPDFSLIDSVALVIDNLILDGNKCVATGYFTPFRWGENEFSAMHFTTILTFNNDGKIILHEDWINYPNTLLDYQTRKNSNLWIE